MRSGERAADVLARWERASRRAPQLLLLRKHLFLPAPLAAPPCAAELHLLLHQLLHQLRADRLPVSHNEAVNDLNVKKISDDIPLLVKEIIADKKPGVCSQLCPIQIQLAGSSVSLFEHFIPFLDSDSLPERVNIYNFG